jgi:hypothetical protein
MYQGNLILKLLNVNYFFYSFNCQEAHDKIGTDVCQITFLSSQFFKRTTQFKSESKWKLHKSLKVKTLVIFNNNYLYCFNMEENKYNLQHSIE